MKKIYSLLVLAVVAALSFAASARTVTLVFNVPDSVASVQTSAYETLATTPVASVEYDGTYDMIVNAVSGATLDSVTTVKEKGKGSHIFSQATIANNQATIVTNKLTTDTTLYVWLHGTPQPTPPAKYNYTFKVNAEALTFVSDPRGGTEYEATFANGTYTVTGVEAGQTVYILPTMEYAIDTVGVGKARLAQYYGYYAFTAGAADNVTTTPPVYKGGTAFGVKVTKIPTLSLVVNVDTACFDFFMLPTYSDGMSLADATPLNATWVEADKAYTIEGFISGTALVAQLQESFILDGYKVGSFETKNGQVTGTPAIDYTEFVAYCNTVDAYAAFLATLAEPTSQVLTFIAMPNAGDNKVPADALTMRSNANLYPTTYGNAYIYQGFTKDNDTLSIDGYAYAGSSYSLGYWINRVYVINEKGEQVETPTVFDKSYFSVIPRNWKNSTIFYVELIPDTISKNVVTITVDTPSNVADISNANFAAERPIATSFPYALMNGDTLTVIPANGCQIVNVTVKVASGDSSIVVTPETLPTTGDVVFAMTDLADGTVVNITTNNGVDPKWFYTFNATEGLDISFNNVPATYKDGVYTVSNLNPAWGASVAVKVSEAYESMIKIKYVISEDNDTVMGAGASGEYYVLLADFPTATEFDVQCEALSNYSRKIVLKASDPKQLGVVVFTTATTTPIVFSGADNADTLLITATQSEISIPCVEGFVVKEVTSSYNNVVGPEEPVQTYLLDLSKTVGGEVVTITTAPEGESGIADIVLDENANNEVYNLQGIRVNRENLPAGVYIVNGQKVLVK